MSNVAGCPCPESVRCVCSPNESLLSSLLSLVSRRPFRSSLSSFKQAKKTLCAVADALERTVPLQEILANAVWLGDEDIIRKYGGTLGDERKEHRWIDKFAFVGLNPLPQAPERAMKIGDLNARLKLIKEKVRVGNGANSRCRPSVLPSPPPSSLPPVFPSLSTCRSTRPYKHCSAVCCIKLEKVERSFRK